MLIEVGKIHAVSKLITSAQWIDFAHNDCLVGERKNIGQNLRMIDSLLLTSGQIETVDGVSRHIVNQFRAQVDAICIASKRIPSCCPIRVQVKQLTAIGEDIVGLTNGPYPVGSHKVSFL